jgi:hypothetical protein
VKSKREYNRGEASARRGGGVNPAMQRVDGGRELWGRRPMTRQNWIRGAAAAQGKRDWTAR